MSVSRTISVVHRLDGALVDYDSIPVLRNPSTDPPPAYGVKRVSDGSVLVAANTSFVRLDVGTYEYEILGLVIGAAYSAWVEYISNGETKRNELLWTASNTSAAGLYADETDLDILRGIDNITNWSDLENTKIRNVARIQSVFDDVDAWIERELDRMYSFPLNLSETDARIVKGWSTVLVAYSLYRNRGINQTTIAGRQATNPYQAELKEVLDEMWLYRNNKRSLNNNKISGADTRITLGNGLLRGNFIPRFRQTFILF